jgi:hypothetical protein
MGIRGLSPVERLTECRRDELLDNVPTNCVPPDQNFIVKFQKMPFSIRNKRATGREPSYRCHFRPLFPAG